MTGQKDIDHDSTSKQRTTSLRRGIANTSTSAAAAAAAVLGDAGHHHPPFPSDTII